MMKTAQYGRMRLGRCVRKDLGYIGCYQGKEFTLSEKKLCVSFDLSSAPQGFNESLHSMKKNLT